MPIPVVLALAGLLTATDSSTASPGSAAPPIGITVDLSQSAPGGVLRFVPGLRLGLAIRPYPPAPARRGNSPLCAARIVPADPLVDPQIAVRAPRDVDRGMAKPGPCAVEAPAPPGPRR